ncbi:MAG TPA: SusC/RagA family TonB-linked outer membrane protein [Prevotella sp.]|nr:SusC/RagA family TonB-linked outer membrane protein [Prevotella sp.]
MKQAKRFFQIISLLVVMLFMSVSTISAQTKIRGSVIDENGEPLIGATIVMKGKPNVAAVSDLDGNFVLEIPTKKATLVITYVGMASKELEATGAYPIKIIMKSDAKMLDETVVVGYGQQKKASVVGSITQTTGKVLERAGGVSSIGEALTGNLPGVVTMSSTGMPGEEDPKIVIRGVSSWNSSDPLVLVDGVERPMSSIDISSVESVSVLKDASATAVYGVKGANGVILITTKRGQEGKAKIEIGMNMTAKVVSKLPSTLHSADALYVRNEAIEHELGLSPNSWSKITPAAILEKYRNPSNLEESERYPDVDWQDEVFKNHAMAYNPNINISGGTKYVKYFAAIDFLHEGDMFRQWNNNRGYKAGYGFDRINVRSNLDFRLTKTTTFKANIFGSHGVRKGPWGVDTGSFGESQLWQAAYSAPHDAFLPRYSDGTWGYYPADTQGAPNSIANLALSGEQKYTTTRINTDFILEQNLSFLLKGLKANISVSWDNVFLEDQRGINDLYHDAQYKWINPDTGQTTYQQSIDGNTNFDFYEGIKWNTAGGTVENNASQRNLFYQGQLFWGNKFGNHDITAMGVFNRTENTTGSQFTNYREDWAFRTTYNYAEKYFFEYNGAYNGSEKFAKKNRFAFFNSGAIGYMISEEKFFTPLRKYIDMLKFRYSYGQVGDDNVPARWLYVTQWAYGGNMSNGLYDDKSPYTWYKEASVGNPDVHWEKAVKQNFGIDYSFLGGLLAGSVELFHENRSDILISGNDRAMPSYYGTTAPTFNYGRVHTKGYELELRINKTIRDLHLWGNFNMTHAENKIVRYDDAELLPAYQKKAGFAIDQDHAYLTTGFANTWDQVIGMTPFNTNDNQNLPGQYTVIDYNGDGIIDSNDNAPYGYTGTPQNTYNATIGFDWKGWSFYAQFYGVTNVDRYVGFNSLGGNLDTVFNEGSFWTKNNTNADAPMPRWNSTPSYYEGTRFHYDGSFIRLKNMEIAYTWTKGWIKHFSLTSLKIYLNGNNLWVWSRMPDDRESNYAGTGLASQGAYPTVKRFNLGVKIDL